MYFVRVLARPGRAHAEAAIGLLPVGANAPDVLGVGNGGKRTAPLRTCADTLSGRFIFIRKSETPGCTHEACAFRDAFVKYETRHVVIFGVSRATPEDSHREFRGTHKLSRFRSAGRRRRQHRASVWSAHHLSHGKTRHVFDRRRRQSRSRLERRRPRHSLRRITAGDRLHAQVLHRLK